MYLPAYQDVIVTGDLNINLLLPSSGETSLRDQINACSLYLVPSEPTHHATWKDRPSHTWLDVFLIGQAASLISYNKSPSPFIDGHDFIFLTYKFAKPPPSVKTILTRSLNLISTDRLNEAITRNLIRIFPADPDLTSILPFSDLASHSQTDTLLSERVNALSEVILAAFNEVAPIRPLKISSSRKPWASSEIRGMMSDRDRAYKRARCSNAICDFNFFKSLRRKVSNALDSAKNEYFAQRIDTAPSPACKWRELRKIGVSGSLKPSPFTCFSAADLSAHYVSISCSSLPFSARALPSSLRRPLHSQPDALLDFVEVSETEVLRIILSSKSKATGPDGISADMLKLAAPLLSPQITSIFNASLAKFPTSWKKAFLSPLAKTATMASMSDTRPIAKLSEISKALERVAHAQLSAHLEKSGLLDSRQSCFRKGHSTQTALLGVLDDIRWTIENRMVTVLILFDFTKAFDTVPHALLLLKLRRLMCSDRTLAWLYSYLHERLQAVVDESGTTSDWLKVMAGVPQGSVLGPLLFLAFINDLPSILSFSKHMIFADDTQIYHSFLPDDLDKGIAEISRDAEAVASWAAENGLALNVAKTKVMLLGSEQFIARLQPNSIPKVTVLGEQLPYSSVMKNLGVWITPTLNWSKHVSHIMQRVYGSLRSLHQCRHALSRPMKKNLVETLIFPHLDYACAVYNHLDKERALKLQRALNACVRFVCGNIPRRGHVTPHRIQLGWLSTARRREYFIGAQAFAAIAHKNPDYLSSKFQRLHIDIHVRTSSRLHQSSLYIPPCRTEAQKNSFSYAAAGVINSLPPPTFEPELQTNFKADLFDELMRRDRRDWDLRIANENISPHTMPHP